MTKKHRHLDFPERCTCIFLLPRPSACNWKTMHHPQALRVRIAKQWHHIPETSPLDTQCSRITELIQHIIILQFGFAFWIFFFFFLNENHHSKCSATSKLSHRYYLSTQHVHLGPLLQCLWENLSQMWDPHDSKGSSLIFGESNAAPTSLLPAPRHAHKSLPMATLPSASSATSFWLLCFSSLLVSWIGGFLPPPAPLRGAKPILPKRSGFSVFPTFCFEFKRQWLAGSWAGVICRSAESQESKLNFLLVLKHGLNYDIIQDYSLTKECYNAETNGVFVPLHIHQQTASTLWAEKNFQHMLP